MNGFQADDATVADIALAFTRRTTDKTLTAAQRAALREAFYQQIRAAKIPPPPPPAPPCVIAEIDLPAHIDPATVAHALAGCGLTARPSTTPSRLLIYP